MSEIIVYANQSCPFCIRARKLLDVKGLEYELIDVTSSPGRWVQMEERSGRNTIPQVFVKGQHVGGYDDLYAADQSGRLDEMLKG
ncbi:MAG: glutaredoxin 3 [Thiomicrospira sp.]|uniref:glutaredoxin 3 n=1 Tax=Thiomicrospira sp. TaxID=935 RepID=UPI001A09A81A|nr:glutaredoxin 3 [Thiomicrospira sp.]MBE0493834.1 glutaredoxin 3 [Thiomicrospira sp.]